MKKICRGGGEARLERIFSAFNCTNHEENARHTCRDLPLEGSSSAWASWVSRLLSSY